MEDSIVENKNDVESDEQATGSFSLLMSQFGEAVYSRVLRPVKSKIEKIINTRKAKKTVNRGFELIRSKLYNRATVEFQNAMELNENVALRMLEEEFNGMELSSDAEAQLSMGLIILKKRDQDFALANNLGNYARRLGDYKQANDLYRKSLRINKSYQKAFYNLAASMGKVNKYDHDVKQTIDTYIKNDSFIVPEYQNNPEIIKEVAANLKERKRAEKQKRLKKLKEEKEQKEAANEKYEVKRINNSIEKLEKISIEPTYKEICANLLNRINKSKQNLSTPEEIRFHHGNMFNLALYAYSENDPELAIQWFQTLKDEKSHLEHIDMMLALASYQKINEKEAIKQLFDLLSNDRYNRYLNVNLGLLYKKAGNRLLAAKYLAIGASLLERSEGLYRISDMVKLAERKYEEGKINRALQLYRIVAVETNNEDAWLKIGQIYREQEKPSEAVKAFQELITVKPDSEEAQKNLMELHDMYCNRAEEVFQNRKFSQAAAFYERALNTVRLPKTIERTAAVYKQLGKSERADELMEELDQIHEQEKEAERERLRQEYIAKGKVYMKRKAFEKAIASLEKAFRMKVDKDVFMSLAYIYKGMNRTQDLSSLMHRWAKMNRYEEELKRKQKDKEREAAMVGDEEDEAQV